MRSQHHLRRRHGGAGVAGGHETLQLGRRAPDAGQRASTNRAWRAPPARFVIHGDDFAGMHDIDRKLRRSGIARQFSAQSRRSGPTKST